MSTPAVAPATLPLADGGEIIHDIEAIVKVLVDAGIRATDNPQRIDPPCVLVMVESATFDLNCPGTGPTNWVLHVLAGQPGGLDAVRQLSKMTAEVIRAIPRIGEVTVTSQQVDTGDPWTAFDLRFTTVSSWA